ncbi:MAG: hypothetical protein UFA98_10425 [Ruminococcus sp.]|nr:hypothetical protein [Ruminococcus sp.]
MKHNKEKMNNITELVFILDRSGSMSGLEADTIGGFNSMLAKQKKQEGRAYVTTVLFDHEIETLHDRIPLRKVKPLTGRDYTVRGCTALLDAIGDTIKHIASIHRYARKEDVPANTMFVITTDGMENASRRYNSEEIKKMIEKEKAKYGWEFLFIGANIDAVETARTYGIAKDRAVNYHADSKGTGVVYEAVSEAVGNMRCSAPIQANWSDKINNDYNNRKRRK